MKQTDQLRARWAALAPREQRLLGGAAALVALALVWWLALAPALRTLSSAPDEHARLDAQLQQMTTLQARARQLQAQPRANPDDAQRALQASVRDGLGPQAQLRVVGGTDGANLSVRGVPATTLAQWLAQARGNARATPREVHLTRAQSAANATPGSTPAAAPERGAGADAIRWDGTLVMTLPVAR